MLIYTPIYCNDTIKMLLLNKLTALGENILYKSNIFKEENDYGKL